MKGAKALYGEGFPRRAEVVAPYEIGLFLREAGGQRQADDIRPYEASLRRTRA